MVKVKTMLAGASLLVVVSVLVPQLLFDLQSQKVEEDIVPLSQAPITPKTIELTPEQELLKTSLDLKKEDFKKQLAKAESAILTKYQTCLAAFVEGKSLKLAAQEPEMSLEQALVAELNTFLKSSTEEANSGNKKTDGKPDKKTSSTDSKESAKIEINISGSPACAHVSKDIQVLLLIAAYENNTGMNSGDSLLSESLNIPKLSLIEPVQANINDVAIKNIISSYTAFAEERQKWEISHQESWSGE